MELQKKEMSLNLMNLTPEQRVYINNLVKVSRQIGFEEGKKSVETENSKWLDRVKIAHDNDKYIIELAVSKEIGLILTNPEKYNGIQWKKILWRIKQDGGIFIK